jgi:signal transduction histidine kinase
MNTTEGNATKPVLKEHDLLATLAHDLRNPIGAIMGYADALLDTVNQGKVEPGVRALVEKIQAVSARAVELVKNYQMLSLLDHKPAQAPKGSTSLSATVREVVTLYWHPGERDLELKIPDHPLPVKVSPTHLERIVSNLVNNAFKFTPPGGKIVILCALTAKGTLFSVTNTGSFISEQQIPTLFTKFGRTDSANGVPGTGLGLYIVKAIVDAVGAVIEVQSSPEGGTSFAVYFN